MSGYQTTVTMNTIDVELKTAVQWFGLDIPVTQSPFALRRIIFRAMRDMIEKGLVQQSAMTHCYPTVMRYRMAVFQPTELGDKVRIALPAAIEHNAALSASTGEQPRLKFSNAFVLRLRDLICNSSEDIDARSVREWLESAAKSTGEQREGK